MAREAGRGSNQFHDLTSVKTLLFEPSKDSGGETKDRMIDIGLRDLVTCRQVSDMPELLAEHIPDLLLIDMDADRGAVCEAVQALRSQDQKGGNPFAVIIGLTLSSRRDIVEEALAAGCDGLLAKPVTGPTLRECLNQQIDDRRNFIATDEYVGPDHRKGDREPTDEELVSIEVPNSLKSKVSGEELDPAEARQRVEEALQSLSVQRVWHLSRRLSELAENARKTMEAGNDFPLLGECVEGMESALSRIDELDKDYDLPGVTEVVTSARAALATIGMAGEALTARHFELLRVHADAVEVSMKQDDEARKVLVTELERAVGTLRARDLARPKDAGKPAEQAKPGKKGHSLKVKFLAWWEGMEPDDLLAARQESP